MIIHGLGRFELLFFIRGLLPRLGIFENSMPFSAQEDRHDGVVDYISSSELINYTPSEGGQQSRVSESR